MAGIFPCVLVVRDLGSGKLLLAEPCRTKDAERVAEQLEALPGAHGAPLVIKGDRGCVSGVLEELAGRWGFRWLHSPGRTATYNGTIEATIDWLAVHADREASPEGHGGRWNRGNLEARRRWLNTGGLG